MKTFRKSIPISRKILGIDPGYDRLGFGLILSKGRENKVIKAGVITSDKKKEWGDRLFGLAAKIEKFLKEEKPNLVVLEKIFFSRNQKTALKVSQVCGVVVYLCKNRNIPVIELSPNELKSGLTGYGFAGKEQIKRVVQLVLKADKIQKIDDVSDALALALLGASYTR